VPLGCVLQAWEGKGKRIPTRDKERGGERLPNSGEDQSKLSNSAVVKSTSRDLEKSLGKNKLPQIWIVGSGSDCDWAGT